MARRHFLKWTVVSLVVVGAVATAVPFLGSMTLNPRSGKELPRLDIAGLEPGGVRIFRLGEKRGFGEAVVVTRDLTGSIHAFRLMMSDSRIGLPGASWNVNFWCDDFGEVIPYGRSNMVALGCRDAPLQRQEVGPNIANSQWTLAGKGLGTWNADLDPARFVIEQNELVVGKRP